MRWVLAALSLSLALVLGEVVCRIALPRPGFIPVTGNAFPGAIRPHPTRLYQLVPNYSATLPGGTFGQMTFRTNADGLRERPLSVVRQSKVRILAIGDSFTFGTGIDGGETWPARLERTLRQRLPADSSVAVINAGVPAYGLAQLRDLTVEMLPKVEPQLLLLGVYTGGFDRLTDPFTAFDGFVIRRSLLEQVRPVKGGMIASPMTRPSAIAFDQWLQQHWHLAAYLFEGANRIRGVVLRRLRPAAHPSLATLMQGDSVTALQAGLAEIHRIQQEARNRGVTLVVVLAPGFDRNNSVPPNQQRLADAVARFCADSGIALFDPTAPLEASGMPLRLRPDDIHLSAAANAVVADRLADYLIGHAATVLARGSARSPRW